MDEKKTPDWELAERLYRTGQLSNVQIGIQCGMTEAALRKRAKRDGWTKDLTAKVQEATKARLVREVVRGSNAQLEPRTEREIVELAAENAAAVVRLHRRDLTKGQQLCALLFGQLQEAAENREELNEIAAEQALVDGQNGAGQRLANFRKAISLPTHAGVIRDLSTAMKNFQALERIAWNLNQQDEAPPDYEAELKRLAASK
jgi:hypothetical protein